MLRGMPVEKPNLTRVPRMFRKVWIFASVVALLLLWFLHPLVLSWALARALESWSSANHLVFSAEKIDARFNGPVILRGVKFRSLPGSGLATALDIPFFEWHWSGLASIFSDKEGYVNDLTVKGLSGIWDLSAGEPAHDQMAGFSPQRWLPRDIFVEASTLELLGKNAKCLLHGFTLSLSESAVGQMEARPFSLYLGNYSKSLGPLRARTAWKNGTLWIAGMEVAPGVSLENLSLDFLHADGPAISLAASCFGGSLLPEMRLGRS